MVSNIKNDELRCEANRTFRVLRWTSKSKNSEKMHLERAVTLPERNCEKWHFHKHSELTLIRYGEGTRLVGNNVGDFYAGGRDPMNWPISDEMFS